MVLRDRSRGANLTARFALVLSLTCGPMVVAGWASDAGEESLVASVENLPDKPSVLVFKDGSRFQTTLFEVRVLGILRTERKVPFLVLKGRGCTECDANTSIYIHSPSDGAMRGAATQPRYSYPGREVSYEDNKTVLYEARTFLGNCLPGNDNAVIWYERGRTKGGAWEAGVFVVSVRKDKLTELRLAKPLPSVSQSVDRVAARQCRELGGVERSSEP
jgi:hypothetical protein